MVHIAVKTLTTLSRGLRTLEALAAAQPVGLTELAGILGEDKSALQRTLATLHADGWIAPSPGARAHWELTTRALSMAGGAAASSPLVTRGRPLLGALRDATTETAHLALVAAPSLVVVDVAEARQVVRTALHIGRRLPADTSAGGRAVCAELDAPARGEFTYGSRDLLDPGDYSEIHQRGWAVCEGDVKPGWTSVAGAVRAADGRPVGAVVVSGPSTRLAPERYPDIGPMVRDVVAELSGA
ncbi:IclR family transcriptional regulator [Tomitella fengzijianii]|uniref:IclR family transcriptional regulator n=1 Tax=Tomitella fengzijianii TaxID=2597660 RepID=A0A516X6T1_9ACTN|nr:IclR family transcriptional regulator [Tomitella fengzijianii]QDQ98779.1 IclR family transcriptional regulator [Tomitella fengzijianii]